MQPSLHNNVRQGAHLVKSAQHATLLCLNKDVLLSGSSSSNSKSNSKQTTAISTTITTAITITTTFGSSNSSSLFGPLQPGSCAIVGDSCAIFVSHSVHLPRILVINTFIVAWRLLCHLSTPLAHYVYVTWDTRVVRSVFVFVYSMHVMGVKFVS